MYKIPDTDELVFTIFYEPLWKSDSPHILVLLEPVGNWYRRLEKTDILWNQVEYCAKKNMVPGNTPKTGERFWHCAAYRINFDLATFTAEILQSKLSEMLAPDGQLMKTATEVIEIMNRNDSTNKP